MLKNRTQRTVKRVSLRWLLTADEEQAAAVLRGDTPGFEVMLPARAYQKADTPLIDFAKIARPLMRDGVLDGKFLLKLRVGEVTFADATVWRYDAPAAGFFSDRTALPSSTSPYRKCFTMVAINRNISNVVNDSASINEAAKIAASSISLFSLSILKNAHLGLRCCRRADLFKVKNQHAALIDTSKKRKNISSIACFDLWLSK